MADQGTQPFFRVVGMLLLIGLVAVAGCGRQLLSVVLDVPPKAPAPVSATSFQQAAQVVRKDTVRPAIEYTLNPDSVKRMLPKDHAGNIDWMAAHRSGIIKPRSALPNDTVVVDESNFQFGFDFFFKGPAPMFDAYFPHSAHTEWVACAQCHPRIFKYPGTQIKMADVLQGNYCGECHGKVAFPPVTGCERCHVDLPQQPNRAQPDLLGTIRMKRVAADSGTVAPDSIERVLAAAEMVAATNGPDANETVTTNGLVETQLISSASLPEAVFPHWVHRIRYECKACHMDLFEPKAGANAVTMAEISAGEACGSCHNGKAAFAAGFGNCFRCHQPIGAASP